MPKQLLIITESEDEQLALTRGYFYVPPGFQLRAFISNALQRRVAIM